MTLKQVRQFASIVVLLTVAAGLWIAHGNPSTQYEVSIYEALPTTFWILISTAAASSFGLCLFEVWNRERGNGWPLGPFLLIPTMALIHALPAIRGYYVYGRNDVLTYFGLAQDIEATGFVTSDNFYPLIHLLAVQEAALTGTSIVSSFGVIPPILYVLFATTYNLFLRQVWPQSKSLPLLMFMASTPFIPGNQFEGIFTEATPYALATSFLPLLLYSFARRTSPPTVPIRAILCILLVSITLAHALVAAIVTLVFVAAAIPLDNRLTRRFIRTKPQRPSSIDRSPALLSAVVLAGWMLSFAVWNVSLARVVLWLVTGYSPSTIDLNLGQASKVASTPIELIDLGLRLYGPAALFIVLGLVGSMLPRKRMEDSDQPPIGIVRLLLRGLLTTSAFLALVFGVLNPHFFQFRLVGIIAILALPLAKPILERIRGQRETPSWTRSRIALPMFLSAIIATATVGGVSNVFLSPYISQPNEQVTHADFAGFTWYFEFKDPAVPASHIMSVSTFRFADAVLGRQASLLRADAGSAEVVVPDHLGYAAGTCFGTAFPNGTYFHLSDFDRHLYVSVWPQVGRYNAHDFGNLSSDMSANLIYTNSGLQVWFVPPSSPC